VENEEEVLGARQAIRFLFHSDPHLLSEHVAALVVVLDWLSSSLSHTSAFSDVTDQEIVVRHRIEGR
jgi:hypothetical protein